MTVVRTGTGLDEDAVVAVWQAAQAARGRRSGGARAQRVRAKLRDPLALLLVAEGDDGRPVGVLLAELGREDGGRGVVVPGLLHLSMLFVHPSTRRQGVAVALLSALTDRYPWVTAWAGADDAAALAACARAGFSPTGATQELAEGPLVQLERRVSAAGA